MSSEEKKERIINRINNHFDKENEFPEILQLSNEDMDQIIELYEQLASKDGKDPWYYLYFDDLIIMQRSVFEVIKDNSHYTNITTKLCKLYEKELNRRLTRHVFYYGEEIDETYRSSYANMEEESLVLAEMCAMNMNYGGLTSKEQAKAVQTYLEIRSDFMEAGIEMPKLFERELTGYIGKTRAMDNNFDRMRELEQKDAKTSHEEAYKMVNNTLDEEDYTETKHNQYGLSDMLKDDSISQDNTKTL